MAYLIAILALAALCGVWVVVQQLAGDTSGTAGRCGACAHREASDSDGTEEPGRCLRSKLIGCRHDEPEGDHLHV